MGSRRVIFERFGGPEVLRVVETTVPRPSEAEVLVRVGAAGLNPVDHKIVAGGAAAERFGARAPGGVGHDFAGTIESVGPGVVDFRVGDVVFGGARHRALADHVIVTSNDILLPRPDGLDANVAAALAIAGLTAWGSSHAFEIGPDDTVLVTAAAGGVGVLAAQLALRRGARVLGTAGTANHDFLSSIGVEPVLYGDGLVERVRAAGAVSAVLDFHGAESILAAFELGVAPERINSVADRGFADRGVRSAARTEASLDDLERVAGWLASGELVLPIDSTYPLERVADAYRRLMSGHLRGKVVVIL